MSTIKANRRVAGRAEKPSADVVEEVAIPRRSRSKAIPRLVIVVVTAAALLATGVLVGVPGVSSSRGPAPQVHIVTRGPLEVTVVEQGELESAKNVEIKCEVEGGGGGTSGGSSGGTQIVWLFPEGEFARKGQKLVELEQSALRQQEVQQQIAVETARQEMITAENDFEAAKIAVDEYLYGTFESDLATAESEIAVAEENVRRAQESAQHSQEMYQRGYASKTQLEADQFAVQNAELTLRAVRAKRNALVDYTKAKMTAELQSKRESARAAVTAAQAKFELEQAKLRTLQEQLQKCVISAPHDGMVIFANDQWWRQERQVDEGAVVHFGQTLIRLPDLTDMQVKANVHESMIEKVAKDQKATISVDALPDLQLHGVVLKINNQPEPNRWMSPALKEYAVNISIEEKVEDVKPGMTAEVKILVDRRDSVLTVPVQAVVQKGKENYCYVLTDGDIEERPVILGISNDVFVEVRDGLNEEEPVVLNPRSTVPAARSQTTGSPQQQGSSSGPPA
jgi:RND family efflux transporter MFP subunit